MFGSPQRPFLASSAATPSKQTYFPGSRLSFAGWLRVWMLFCLVAWPLGLLSGDNRSISGGFWEFVAAWWSSQHWFGVPIACRKAWCVFVLICFRSFLGVQWLRTARRSFPRPWWPTTGRIALDIWWRPLGWVGWGKRICGGKGFGERFVWKKSRSWNWKSRVNIEERLPEDNCSLERDDLPACLFKNKYVHHAGVNASTLNLSDERFLFNPDQTLEALLVWLCTSPQKHIWLAIQDVLQIPLWISTSNTLKHVPSKLPTLVLDFKWCT